MNETGKEISPDVLFRLHEFYHDHPRLSLRDTTWPEMEKDHLSLIALVKIFDIHTILEIGTWRGYTAALLCSLPQVKKVHAIDVCTFDQVAYRHPSHPLSSPDNYGYWARGSPKYSIEFCDSMKRQPDPGETYDMVIIDGDHEYQHVLSDTSLALKLARRLMVWHDYPNEGGVKHAVDDTGMGISKIIASSLVCYHEIPHFHTGGIRQ